jgi:pimeloyl-ACP methyl ester carboxylesterase
MVSKFEQDSRFNNWWLDCFEYDFNQEMTLSAQQLIEALTNQFSGSDNVTLVGHSMGGLIGRFAIMSGKVPFVKRLIMLGTPNFGALRTGQLGPLASMTQASLRTVYGICTRKTGIQDLARVPKVYKQFLETNPNASVNAAGVEYITIPGTFFHEERAFWELGERQLWTSFFGALNLTSQVLDAVLPMWKIGLKRPHDGIVERKSNKLIPTGSGRWSEKTGAINNSQVYEYAHIEHEICDSLTHIAIEQNDDIIQLAANIIAEGNVKQWYKNLTNIERNSISIKPKP